MKTIFLIDDDADDREIFQEALSVIESDTSINFQEAENGADAFVKLNDPDTQKPDVIFVDLNMPKMDGKEFLMEIKKQPSFKDIPVIIYSTSANKSDIDFTLQHHAEKFMTKPHSIFDLKKELESTLRQLLGI
ncbi:hypothetical protein FNO01nite_28840 [Flavobacterium noncentrifugens]|uniref:Response regulator receiver domain-containing protein n=1 Tax=Flavobacterium noncentrifugens TaxID=1128970 RepID=A0A1G8XWE2_9FLAO|nr:response regulator [Flavobacterium noncentrifugens]GEP52212.1 hypothetical protein FNO01nite_28840 [Flavobacterium noncentrifugens]SDJ94823.1 Response regulator receiver domain-containing protein [Flavobacterium noncentrifugens]